MKKDTIIRLKRYTLKFNKPGGRWKMYDAVSLDEALDFFIKESFPHTVKWKKGIGGYGWGSKDQLVHVYAEWDKDDAGYRTFEFKYNEWGPAIQRLTELPYSSS